ncbi:ubiquitin fusion degradation protein [Seiridium cupressi]
MAEQPPLSWSASFAVASPDKYRSKDLKGDKIILPQSALEQLLAASSSSTRSAPSSFTSYDRSNPYSSNFGQPQHAFYADSQQQLPNPLMFRLVNKANGNVVHAGIREFSAEDGEVVLSSYLAEALGIDSDTIPNGSNGTTSEEAIDLTEDRKGSAPVIAIHAKHLSKGTYVRLRPLEAGYNPDDWKSLLERQLRESFTTLTNGAFLEVRGVKGETFRFLIDKFQPEEDGICVVDTDLEVDIEALNEEQARETMRQILAKSQKAPGTAGQSSIGGEINIWKAAEGQVLAGDYVDYELSSWSRSRPLEVELSGLDPDHADAVDLLISPGSRRQRARPRETEHVFGVFDTTSGGTKRITIQPTNVELEEAESVLVSIHGYAPLAGTAADTTAHPFKLRVKSVAGDTPTPMEVENPQEPSPDEEQCQNCHQFIPKRTIVLHENFCRRNNVACPQCGSVFQKNSTEWAEHWHCPHDEAHGSSEATKAKHDDICHTERQCPSCPFSTNSIPDLARHRTTLCPGKIILCQFCHLEVPQEGDPFNPSAETLVSGLTEHEIADGARTTDCHLCGKIVRLRDMSAHLKHHELDKAHRLKPPICRNAICGRTLHGVGKNGSVGAGTQMGQGPGNDLGLCSICFSPMYVQLHDPEGKALRRRIERRYLQQMNTGCKKKWCANEWCKTGRENIGLEAKSSNLKDVLPLIKPLMETVRDTQEPMYFCVDETTQRRRKLAELLAAEKAWDLEWCVAACEAEGPNLDKAREWLLNWAPMMA